MATEVDWFFQDVELRRELQRRITADLEPCELQTIPSYHNTRRGLYETSGQGCPESEIIVKFDCRLRRTSELWGRFSEKGESKNARTARRIFLALVRRIFSEAIKVRALAHPGTSHACPTACPTPLQTNFIVTRRLHVLRDEIVLSGEVRVVSFCVAFGDGEPPDPPPEPGTSWAPGSGRKPTAGAIISTPKIPSCPGVGPLTICSYVAEGQIPEGFPTEGDWRVDTKDFALSASFAVMGDPRLRKNFCRDDDCVASFKKVKGSDVCVSNPEERATRCCTDYTWACTPVADHNVGAPPYRLYSPGLVGRSDLPRRGPRLWAPEAEIFDTLLRSSSAPINLGFTADAPIESSWL